MLSRRRPALVRALARLRADTAGATLVEFAVALPVLIGIYVGGVELSMAIECNRNIAQATHAMVDLASQCPAITSTGTASNTCWINNIFGATAVIMQPYNSSNANMRLSEVQIVSATQMQVIWSVVSNGSTNNAYTPYTAGNYINLPTNLTKDNAAPMFPTAAGGTATQGSYLLLGEVSMNYQPAVSYNGMTSFALSEKILMSPRVSTAVPYS